MPPLRAAFLNVRADVSKQFANHPGLLRFVPQSLAKGIFSRGGWQAGRMDKCKVGPLLVVVGQELPGVGLIIGFSGQQVVVDMAVLTGK